MNQSHLFRGEEEEEDLFFDSREEISSASDSCPGSPLKHDANDAGNFISWVSSNPRYQVWTNNLESVRERRDKFIRLMGLDSIDHDGELKADDEIVPVELDGKLEADVGTPSYIKRIMSGKEADVGTPCSDIRPSVSSWSTEQPSTSDFGDSEESFEYRIKNLDDGTMFIAHEWAKDGSLRSLREVGSDRMVSLAEFERNFGSSSFIQQLMRREDSASSKSDRVVSRRRIGWLRRLGIRACVVPSEDDEINSSITDSNRSSSGTLERVKVRSYKKKSKELSAVYKGQDIKAHDGTILTMKFNPDGQYLATGGEDGVVRVWHIMQCKRTHEFDIPKDDPLCIYFTVNDNSELAPVNISEEKNGKHSNIKRTTDSACVVIPSNIFRISEEPLHEFAGHNGDVLDLSWSKNKYLLSSSTDKTVRLWQLGFNSCLKVFSHNDYVTSVQFNPADENYFISGCIDGIVRIWEICRCHVIDWTDSKEIVTSVCYRPDGKGGVVGTITGNCRFYDVSDNHLQLEAHVSLQGKRKSPHKRITGFQFCPSDPKKLMVTSADSQIRVLHGVEVVSKYKGLRNTAGQVTASFTPDGKHIISASEDSINIWNFVNQDAPISDHVKSTWSCERFFSSHASIAIPWNGLQTRTFVSVTSEVIPSHHDVLKDFPSALEIASDCHGEDSFGHNIICLSPSSFTLRHEFLSEFLPKGSATWPEEKLPSSLIGASTLCKSQYKFLKTSCQNSSHAWGQVIITAGWDGCIRSFQNYGLPVHL
ncbi:uncharacterized protein [Typha latifolia]|uniref:uncharacterized protein n=1 Tax=Typha latifolia TaxID=4733 RepID=UPI003C2E806C